MLNDNYVHKGQRKQLVNALRQKGIHHPGILEAFERIPRHFFLDSAFANQAYQDKPFSIGEGQTISQPYTVAFQTQLLEIQPHEKVLEIGSGSGFQSCILLALQANLYSVEVIKTLHLRAKKMASLLNLEKQAHFYHTDGTKGLPKYAPYQKILVTAGAPIIPTPLIKQLAIGGKLVIPVGDSEQQVMLRITKERENAIRKEEFGHFSFVKLKGDHGW